MPKNPTSAVDKNGRGSSAASAERLRQRRSTRQTAILRAAGAELLAAGYLGANLDKVAEAVFISKATLYHYFPTKRDLYLAWLDMVHTAATQRIEPIASSDLDPVARLRAMIIEEVSLLTTEFPDYARVFMRGMDWPEDLRGVIQSHRDAHENLFRSAIEAGIASEALSVPDVSVARGCVQGCLAYIPEWYRSDGRLSAVEVGEAIAEMVLRLLGAKPIAATRTKPARAAGKARKVSARGR
jgi:AcrR family transcriptional regulator